MDDSQDRNEKSRRKLTRRGFITVMGMSAAGVAASGKLFAQSENSPPAMELKAGELTKIELRINGKPYSLLVEPRWTLLFVLREKIGLTGSKVGCERGECGACTVLIDDIPRYACMALAVEAQGVKITTVEGLMDGEEMGPVQHAFAEEDAYQCGYCTSGQIMAVEGLLHKTPNPSFDEIREGVSGNLCRCGAYPHIFKAAEKAARLKRKE